MLVPSRTLPFSTIFTSASLAGTHLTRPLGIPLYLDSRIEPGLNQYVRRSFRHTRHIDQALENIHQRPAFLGHFYGKASTSNRDHGRWRAHSKGRSTAQPLLHLGQNLPDKKLQI